MERKRLILMLRKNAHIEFLTKNGILIGTIALHDKSPLAYAILEFEMPEDVKIVRNELKT